jgi:hypothetical protein
MMSPLPGCPCSRPSATRKAYLAFEGCVVTSTLWNQQYIFNKTGRLLFACLP